MKKGEKGTRKAQRDLSRKEKGSNNRNKAKINLSKQHWKEKNQRDEFAHKLSNMLVRNNDPVAFEKLNVTGTVKNHHPAKSITGAAWSTIVQYTTYKAESASREAVPVDPRNTSREC